jgi:hypothetical protein
MHEENPDAVFVDVWLTRIAPNSHSMTREITLALFERAIDVIWQEAGDVLGEVTLTAIASRVLIISSEHFPDLSGIRVDSDGFSFQALREQASAMSGPELWESLRFLLLELLRVLGDLTGRVLTPLLHSELAKVALPEPASSDAADQSERISQVSAEGEES